MNLKEKDIEEGKLREIMSSYYSLKDIFKMTSKSKALPFCVAFTLTDKFISSAD